MKCKCHLPKTILLLPLLMISPLLSPLPGIADERVISLSCPDQISCGTEITIPLMISSSPKIDSLGIELTFTSQVTYKNCDFQECLTEGFDYIDCHSPETGRLKCAGFTTVAPIIEGSDGCLVKIEFEVADQCNPNDFWIIISELFDDIKEIPTESCEPPPPTTTTSIIVLPTTTTSIQVCTITISPPSVTLNSGGSRQFKALTNCNGEVVEGTYSWEIIPASTIESSISSDGLFVAGNNETESDIQETVKVTDIDHGNASDIATVTIKRKEKPIPECEVTITPSTKTIYTGEIVTFSAATTCDEEPVEGTYSWSVDSSIESDIDGSGFYTSGHTDTDVTDTVTVTDTANGDVANAATVNVIGTYIEVCPDPMLRSRWIGLLYLMTIQGTNTNFAAFNSEVSFDPENSVFALPPLILGSENIWQLVHVNPSWLSGVDENEMMKVTVTTGAEAISDEVDIQMLPDPLDN